jgi:D-alanyl-D-alanine carboxypeptidase (penicillin-binding protein 5/6)
MKSLSLRLALLACLSLCPALAAAPTLAQRLEPLIRAHEGKIAVAVRHLESGEAFGFQEDEPMPTASLIKLAVMVEAYRQAAEGKLDLVQTVALREEDKVPGSGILTAHFSAGASFALRDAVRLMVAFSDNTATNLVLDRIGLTSTAETMEKLGLPETKIHSKVYRRETSVFPERSQRFGLGSTTAKETLRLLERLYRREVADAAACEAMLKHLEACDDRSKLARFLPEGVRFAHKSGSLSNVRADAGIIYSGAGPIAVCVLTSDNKDQRWHDDAAGNLICARIGKAVYEHFNPLPDADPLALRPLEIGAAGPLVEALQRTLNARLEPSPALAIDGDFGPATRDALSRFQSARGLEATGIVEESTWKALGALVTEDPAVPDPDVVNRQALPLAPAEALDGPPAVTAKAWAVGDAESGELLWSAEADQRLHFASVTKVMTAVVILDLAEADPKVLDEELVVSARADATPGSTAGIRAGERLPVREALYGLLLPSGNDAALALAEHFGPRLASKGGADPVPAPDAVDAFVARMNRAAAELGLESSSFANPHGLTDPKHLSTARDLLELSWRALQLPRFRELVSTRQRGCAVRGPGGYTRNVLWRNTNQLLAIEGYAGVKTGTTEAAGACLVSTGTRGRDALIVVVLGASSSPARYADARNLFRWAWARRK